MGNTTLQRQLGLTGLVATGVCSMLGASINVVPFMIQKHVPGIGAWVLPAFLFAAIPALFAAYAYAALATGMPKAGGSYIYASRGLHPYLGFVASFSQWFGLSIVIGVVAYVTIPFLRDIAEALQWEGLALGLETGLVRIGLALALIWTYVWINIRGLQSYQKSIIPLMVLMFGMGGVVIITGFFFNQDDFTQAVVDKTGSFPLMEKSSDFKLSTFLSAGALLFASFIGFDSIAQAGGEAKNPGRNLPVAIGLTIGIVGLYYVLFTMAVYNTIPWEYVAQEANQRDITAPGLLAPLLPDYLILLIVAGAAVALINDLPAMLLSVSRLVFAWSEDGIFPKTLSNLHTTNQTPYNALILSGIVASVGVLGSHFAGNFFLGIDIMVTSMMVNFLLICLTLAKIDSINPSISSKLLLAKNVSTRKIIAWTGVATLSFFLVVHTYKDLITEVEAWYFHSTYVWILVMILASLIFFLKFRKLKKIH
ncbi:APC family permease [Mongoliitalea daihaiensis]|uniref:APC family permease n=1 Tax=Mongoliitalea daihaiensis TaxID=2782006 RepID=UPI001F2524E6|nr:APC family permease [Mongoliitalea daihaiensis]UJP66122.1 APC family permease [Mongoliitalea daihaiensis]